MSTAYKFESMGHVSYWENDKFATVKNLIYFLVTGKVDERRVRNAEIERKKVNAFFKKLSHKKYLFLPTSTNSRIMTLGNYINELLYDQNCVVVPGLGGFITRRVPAQINPVSNKITPPGKKLAFNQGLQLNDGILAQFIANRELISYDQALVKIQSMILELRKTMIEHRTIHLEKVGTFYMDQDEVTTFHPEVDINLSKEDFGLVTLAALPLQRSADEKLKLKIKTRVDQRTQAMSKTRKRMLPRIAAAVAACLVIGLSVVGINQLSENNHFNFASFGFSSNSQKSTETAPAVKHYAFPLTETQKAQITHAAAASASDTTWSVLITSFAGISAVRACVDDLTAQNIPARISIKENGMTWVSAVKTGDKQEALKCLDLLKSNYAQAKLVGKKN